MDPMAAFMQWLAQADPQTQASVAAHMDSQGVPPPAPPQMDLGGMMKLGGAPPTDGTGEPSLGQLIPGMNTPMVSDKDTSPMQDQGSGSDTVGQDPKKPSALGQGLSAAGQKLAQPTPTPEIPKGVTGGVRPEQPGQVNPAIVSMIAQLMNHPHATQAGPSLGALIR